MNETPNGNIREKKTISQILINSLKEVVDPFIALFHVPRALWGLNLSYVLEGLTYFGVLGLLAIYYNEYIQLNDIDAGRMVGILTAGITLAMLFLGGTVDWIGVRKSLLISLSFMLFGRLFLTIAPEIGVSGVWQSAHWITTVSYTHLTLPTNREV